MNAANAVCHSIVYFRIRTAFVLMTWHECSADELRRMVMAAPVKSSSLDPIPTFLLPECIGVILPYLTAMVNTSLRSAVCQPPK